MASEGPPEEEDVENRRRPLVLLVDAINTLGLNAHLLIKPFLSTAHLAQESLLSLQLSGTNLLFGLDVGVTRDNMLAFQLRIEGTGLEIVAVGVIAIMVMLDVVRMPHVGLIAVDEIRHCGNN
jgi:hypothetical protein